MALISEKQTQFITSLMADRVNGATYVQTQIDAYKVESLSDLTSSAASNIIGVLLQEPKVKKAVPANYVTEAGMFMGKDGNVYKVQESKWNPGKFYAKRLVVLSKGNAKFEYDPSGMKQISPESKISLQQAIDLGIQHGVCCRCGRDLTAKPSVKAGIGPVCIKYFQ